MSLTLGITTNAVAETDRYSGVLSGKAAVVGVGTRLGDFLRASYMLPVVYSYADATRRQRLTVLQSVSISLDADLLDLLGSFGKALFP
jgi:hypothetical protein